MQTKTSNEVAAPKLSLPAQTNLAQPPEDHNDITPVNDHQSNYDPLGSIPAVSTQPVVL